MTYDRERIDIILHGVLKKLHEEGTLSISDCAHKLEKLIRDVRGDTIEYVWMEARSSYDKGMNPHNYDQSLLFEKANADLNPERE